MNFARATAKALLPAIFAASALFGAGVAQAQAIPPGFGGSIVCFVFGALNAFGAPIPFLNAGSCPAAPPSGSGTIDVVKDVSGGSASPSDFAIHVEFGGADISGSPEAGSASGTSYIGLPAGAYAVSESGGPSGYATSFAGDCDASGAIALVAGVHAVCTITNTWSGSSGGGTGGSGGATTSGTLSGTVAATSSTSGGAGGSLGGTVASSGNGSLTATVATSSDSLTGSVSSSSYALTGTVDPGNSLTGTVGSGNSLTGTVVASANSLTGTVGSGGGGGGGGSGGGGGGGGTGGGSSGGSGGGGNGGSNGNPGGQVLGTSTTASNVPGVPNTGEGGAFAALFELAASSLIALLGSFAIARPRQ